MLALIATMAAWPLDMGRPVVRRFVRLWSARGALEIAGGPPVVPARAARLTS
jgi:hypothetical protein